MDLIFFYKKIGSGVICADVAHPHWRQVYTGPLRSKELSTYALASLPTVFIQFVSADTMRSFLAMEPEKPKVRRGGLLLEEGPIAVDSFLFF